jgi:hypothetical protein
MSGLDAPLWVAMTIDTGIAFPVRGGIVTVQVVWSGQSTGAVLPPTVALM